MEYILTTLGKVGFEWQMGLFNLINFLIVFLILKHYAFGPIMKAIDERQQKEKQSVENFQRSKTELQMAEKRAQELVDEAKVESNKIAADAHENAKQLSQDMKEKAKGEIEKVVAQAKKNIEIDRNEMREDIRREAAGLVVAATEKVIGEKLDNSKDEALIAASIAKN